MLTKEECLEALNYLASGQCSYCWKSGNEEVLVYEDANKMLTQLINEHFDNPPLKFKELKEDMWVWDNKYKEYVRCNPNTNSCGKLCVYFWNEVGDEGEYYEDYLIFEENRFYRKQVE